MFSHVNPTTIATISLIVSIISLFINNSKLFKHQILRNTKGLFFYFSFFILLFIICDAEFIAYIHVSNFLLNFTKNKMLKNVINNVSALPFIILIITSVLECITAAIRMFNKYINEEKIYCYPKSGSIKDKFPVKIYHDYLIRIKNQTETIENNNLYFTQENIELIDPTDNNSPYNILYELEQSSHHPKHLKKTYKFIYIKIIIYTIIGTSIWLIALLTHSSQLHQILK